MREQKRGQHILLPLLAGRNNDGVVSFALDPHIVGEIMSVAVAIVLAIGEVMLLIVSDRILEVKSIMSRD